MLLKDQLKEVNQNVNQIKKEDDHITSVFILEYFLNVFYYIKIRKTFFKIYKFY